jgi:hypothetical protein
MEGPAQVNTMDDFAFYLPNSGVGKGVFLTPQNLILTSYLHRCLANG